MGLDSVFGIILQIVGFVLKRMGASEETMQKYWEYVAARAKKSSAAARLYEEYQDDLEQIRKERAERVKHQ